MPRVLEPSLMTSPEVVSSYASMDRSSLVEFMLGQLLGTDINPENINTVVDVCCGCGDLTVGLAEVFSKSTVLGLDGSDEMLQVAESKLGDKEVSNLSFVRKKIGEDALDEKFDLVISSMALHHFENVVEALKALKDLTASEGNVVVFDMLREENQEKANQLVERITQVYFDSEGSASEVPFKESFSTSLKACLSLEELKAAINAVFGDQEIKVFDRYGNNADHPCDGLKIAMVCARCDIAGSA